MKFKKLAALALTGAMAMSLAAPAFAASTTALTQNTAITGSTEAPTIKITVPTTGTVTVNPYKMEVTVGSAKVTDQIISATQYIENASNVAVKVSAEVTGTVAGNLTLATATTQGTKAVTTNSVFMYFEMAVTDDDSTEPTWAAYDSKSATQILVGSKTVKKADMLTLAAGDGSDAASAGGYAAFHLTGDAASTPTTAWVAADKVDVAIAFTFTPTVTPTT